MKRIQYKSKKWDDKKEEILNKNYYNLKKDELKQVEQQYKDAKYDEVKYWVMRACYLMQLENYKYILEIVGNKQEGIVKIYKAIKRAYMLYENQVSTTKAVERILKGDGEKELAAYYAIAANRVDLAQEILPEDSILGRLLNEEYDTVKKMCSMDHQSNTQTIKNIMCAISDKDEDALKNCIYDRIREIRRQSIEYMVIIDIWLVALLKIAQRRGMTIVYDFVEVKGFFDNEG